MARGVLKRSYVLIKHEGEHMAYYRLTVVTSSVEREEVIAELGAAMPAANWDRCQYHCNDQRGLRGRDDTRHRQSSRCHHALVHSIPSPRLLTADER